MKTLAIINHKGGVGKTTITLNLSAQLAKIGKKTLVIDFDPQANLSGVLLGEEESFQTIDEMMIEQLDPQPFSITDKLDILPSSLKLAKCERMFGGSMSGYFKLKKLLEALPETYEYVLVDCPPSLGWLTQNALNTADSVIIPSEPSKFSSDGFDTLVDVIDEVKETTNGALKIEGILLSMVRNLRVHNAYSEQIREEYDDLIFECQISNLKDYTEANAMMQAVVDYAPESKASKEIETLANELMAK